jgi:hypothetical protein
MRHVDRKVGGLAFSWSVSGRLVARMCRALRLGVLFLEDFLRFFLLVLAVGTG